MRSSDAALADELVKKMRAAQDGSACCSAFRQLRLFAVTNADSNGLAAAPGSAEDGDSK